MKAAYDLFSKEFPALPYPKPEYFKEAVTTLGMRNEKMRGFEVSKVLDQSFVQSAADRGLDKSKPPRLPSAAERSIAAPAGAAR